MIAPVALVCHRSTQTGPITVEATYWETTEQARQAEAELTPCGPFCIGVHSAVRLDRGPDRRRRPSLRTRTTSTTGADGAAT
ncbi:hypothetical protein [Mycobacterium sp. ZZG]